MTHWIALLKVIGALAVMVMFGAALYIRHLAKQKDMWRDFMYSFTGNIRFYRENWRGLRLALFLMLLAILVLIWTSWALRRLGAPSG
jgi:hypothetical protein